MRYLATIKYGADSWSQLFNTADEAEQWLDENNNNLEHTAVVDELDDNGKIVDGYVYNKGLEYIMNLKKYK